MSLFNIFLIKSVHTVISVDGMLRKEDPGHTRQFESTYGRENGGTHFARVWLG